MARQTTRAHDSKVELADIPDELAALDNMTVGALTAKHRELFGEAPRSRNRRYLIKRCAFRLQELEQGGLSDGAQAKIAALGSEMPERWRRRLIEDRARALRPPKAPKAAPARDPRLPPPGNVIQRRYRGTLHEVMVETDGFSYQGKHFGKLSAIAKLITGTSWNGFAFFGLVLDAQA